MSPLNFLSINLVSFNWPSLCFYVNPLSTGISFTALIWTPSQSEHTISYTEINEIKSESPDQLTISAIALPLCDQTSTQNDTLNSHLAIHLEEKLLLQSLSPMTTAQYNLSSISVCRMTILVNIILVMASPAQGMILNMPCIKYEKPILIIPSILNEKNAFKEKLLLQSLSPMTQYNLSSISGV